MIGEMEEGPQYDGNTIFPALYCHDRPLFRHYTQPKPTPEGEPSVQAQCVTTEQPSLQR